MCIIPTDFWNLSQKYTYKCTGHTQHVHCNMSKNELSANHHKTAWIPMPWKAMQPGKKWGWYLKSKVEVLLWYVIEWNKQDLLKKKIPYGMNPLLYLHVYNKRPRRKAKGEISFSPTKGFTFRIKMFLKYFNQIAT